MRTYVTFKNKQNKIEMTFGNTEICKNRTNLAQRFKNLFHLVLKFVVLTLEYNSKN